MSTSKLRLNPDKTEFIIFGSKGQRDKLSSHLPVQILETPFSLQSQSKIQVYGLILISLSQSMYRIYARAAFSSLEISDGSVDIFPLMLLFLWPMLLSVVALTTATRSGVCQSTIYVSCNVLKTVLHGLYPIPIGILGFLLERFFIGCLLNNG